MIDKHTAEHYMWAAGCDGWHLVKNGDLSVIHERMAPGTYEALHFHRQSRQFFFVLSGALTLDINGKREVLRSLQGAEIAPGAPHQVINESGEDVEFLVISQPASHGDRVLVIP